MIVTAIDIQYPFFRSQTSHFIFQFRASHSSTIVSLAIEDIYRENSIDKRVEIHYQFVALTTAVSCDGVSGDEARGVMALTNPCENRVKSTRKV